MRFPQVLMVLGTTLLFGSAQAALAQELPVKVEVTTAATHTVWYTDPMWLGLGAVAVLLVIVLLVMASRGGGGKSTTTVVR